MPLLPLTTTALMPTATTTSTKEAATTTTTPWPKRHRKKGDATGGKKVSTKNSGNRKLMGGELIDLDTLPEEEVMRRRAVGHGIGGIDIPAKMARLAKSLSQE